MGMASGCGNLVDFLDVILSDFVRLESETTTAEDNSQASHDKFMNESEDDVALKTTEQKHKEGKRDSTTELNRNLKKELKLTQEELDAALKYYDELKPDCIDMGLSYADRKAQREEDRHHNERQQLPIFGMQVETFIVNSNAHALQYVTR